MCQLVVSLTALPKQAFIRNAVVFLPPLACEPLTSPSFAAAGPGFNGGAAGEPVSLYLTLRDRHGRRAETGGEYVSVRLTPAGPAGNDPKAVIYAEVVDRGDGTYVATYAVPDKGSFRLNVELNGEPVNDSPFPIFFSPPGTGVPAAAAAPTSTVLFGRAEGAADVPGGMQLSESTMAAIASAVAAAASALPPPPAVAEPPPPDPTAEALARTVYVSSISPQITLDQLKTFFGFCGTLKDFKKIPNPNPAVGDIVFAEYSSAAEAEAAVALSGTKLGDRSVMVQTPAQFQVREYPMCNRRIVRSHAAMHRAGVALHCSITPCRMAQGNGCAGMRWRWLVKAEGISLTLHRCCSWLPPPLPVEQPPPLSCVPLSLVHVSIRVDGAPPRAMA